MDMLVHPWGFSPEESLPALEWWPGEAFPATVGAGAGAGLRPDEDPDPRFDHLRNLRGVLRLAAHVGPKYAAIATVAAVQHHRLLAKIALASKETGFRTHLQARPEIWGMIRTTFMSARWEPAERIALIVDHCRTVSRLGPLFDFPPDNLIELPRLTHIGSEYRVTFDQPRWMLRVGQITLSIWHGDARLYSISFSLSSAGVPTAYIGGLQGERNEGGIELFRDFKKAANGMRPQDLTIELMRMLSRATGMQRILAVSDTIHAQRRTIRAPAPAAGFFAGYDEAWRERGGTLTDDGFYALPLHRPARAAADIPTRKRALYRRRDAMLAAIESDIQIAVAASIAGAD
jgi:uncharacterized protein VirK/YbjX